jgi:stage V sporulation protein R
MIKQRLLFDLTNMGRPIIKVHDGNYKNRGELFLKHEFAGPELKVTTARDTLENCFQLWGRPVHIATVLENRVSILSYNGEQHQLEKTDECFFPENDGDSDND